MADNLLDKASILLTPTAYNDGSMLSIKPNENLYGSELVTNGDFSNGSANWTLGTGMSIINEELHITNNSTNDRVYQNIGLVQGKIYQVSFDVLSFSGTSFQILMGGTSTPDIGAINSTGSYTFTQECLGSNGFFYFMSTLSNVVIDNVSVVEDLSGDFQFSRSSAATRVNAQGLVENVQIISSELVSNGNFSQIGTEEVLNGNFSQEGSELITNGDFATDSDWTLRTGWSISGGKANCDGTQTSDSSVLQYIGSQSNKTVKVSFTISNYISGVLQIVFFGSAGTIIENINANGDYTFYINVQSGHNGNTGFRAKVGFEGSIDNVSVKEVGQNWTIENTWTIGDSVANGNGANGATEEIISDITLPIASFKVSYEVKNYVSGSVNAAITGYGLLQNVSSDGVYTEYITTTSTSTIKFRGTNFNGSITNISVKEVGQNWTLGAGWSIDQDNSKAVFDYDSSIQKIYTSNLVLNSNSNYKLSFEIKDILSGTPSIFIANSGGSVGYNGNYTDYSEGVYTFTFSPSSNQTSLAFFSRFSDFSITNISVKEVTDDTDLPRINYSGFSYQDTLGSELVTNGDFAISGTPSTNTYTLGWYSNTANVSITNGNLILTNSVSENSSRAYITNGVSSTAVLITNKSYKLQYEIVANNGVSSLNYVVGSIGYAAPTTIGTHIIYFESGLATSFQLRNRTTNSNIVFDNVSVKEYLGQEVVPDSGCGSWLLEPQSTNLITYSEDFSDSSWVKNGFGNALSPVVTLNTDMSPDGTVNASRIEMDCTSTSSSDYSAIYQQLSLDGSSEYTISFYIKSNTSSEQDLLFFSNSSFSTQITANSEWQRVESTFISNSTNPRNFGLVARGSVQQDVDILIWGAQVEESSYATSYIPTSGASATRNQELCNNATPVINSEEGTLYAEISALANDLTFRLISISDGTNNNIVKLGYRSDTNAIYTEVKSASASQVFLVHTTTDITNTHKVAVKYKKNDFALWIDGVEVLTDTSGNVPIGLSELAFDRGDLTNFFFGNTKGLKYYPKALADVQLEDLTTI